MLINWDLEKKRVECSLQVAFVLCFPPSSILMQLRSSVDGKNPLPPLSLESANLNLLRILNLNKVDGSYHFINKLRHGIFLSLPLQAQLLCIHCLMIFSIQQQAQTKPVRNSFFLAIFDWMLFLADVLCLLPWKLDRCVYFSGDWN